MQECLVHQGIFYFKLTYLTWLVVKKFHVASQTHNFSLHYVAIDIGVKGEWTSDFSCRGYFAVSPSQLYDAGSILLVQKHNSESRASKTYIDQYPLFFS